MWSETGDRICSEPIGKAMNQWSFWTYNNQRDRELDCEIYYPLDIGIGDFMVFCHHGSAGVSWCAVNPGNGVAL